MLVNLTWLKEFIPITASIDEICNVLTQRGLEVESISTPLAYLQNIYVGEVLECTPHTNAEHLNICLVRVGDEHYTIVCGAKNVRSGIRVPVAVVGTVMPNGMEITKARLRGVESCGMICSQAELGIAMESQGIWILPEDAPVGISLAQYYKVEDNVLDIAITPNRGDCLSILGIARELALYYECPITMPDTSYTASMEYTDAMTVDVNEECSSLYAMHNVRVSQHMESPPQMRFRLVSVGIRPINCIVDITNYVMMELGQPLHAFDVDSMQDAKIAVQYAQEGISCTTLDGISRKLRARDIVIMNNEEVLAVAGIMGCVQSEITKTSKTVAIESATFNPITIRTTAKHLGIISEAGYRFERGVNKAMVDIACDRALSLLCSYADVEVSSVRTRVEHSVPTPSILCRPEKVRSLLGITIDDIVIENMLLRLQCMVERKDFFWKITPPTYRLDIQQEADIIEEIARLYGMDTIPTALPSIRYNSVLHAMEGEYTRTMKTKRILQSLGLTETISYSFISQQLIEKIEGITPLVYLHNPLSAEYNVLRTRLLPSLLLVMQQNYNKGVQSLSIFEVASVFLDIQGVNECAVKEKETLALLLSGYSSLQGWGYSKELWDYRDAKGIVMQYIESITNMTCSFKGESQHHVLSPCVRIVIGGESIGVLGRIMPTIAHQFDARHPVWYAEISLEAVYKYMTTAPITYRPLPSYPPISRDITFIVNELCGIGTILDVIRSMSLPVIESMQCIDVYMNESTCEKHITVRIILRDSSKTLTDKEADMYREDIVRHVVQTCNARV